MNSVFRLTRGIFSTRGWGLLVSAVPVLLGAQIMGRRDLLYLGLLLIILPLVSLAGTRVIKPRFDVYREFSPASVDTSGTTTVSLAISSPRSVGGRVLMEERLPQRFGSAPSFYYPARSPSETGASRYEYHLRSNKRGLFQVGPVTAEFSDPFGLCKHRHALDGSDTLTVTPAAVELPTSFLTGARGSDGVTSTRQQANPSDDDVMTREYRHGDPMRRVHWAATARHGSLMVRQEESVTTPEATLIIEQRFSSFAGGFASVFATAGADLSGSEELLTSANFEWAVTAAVSIASHLIERNYSLRLLDPMAEPALRRSPSAPFPDDEHYSGTAGLQSVAEGLAAIELWDPQRPRRNGRDVPESTGQKPFDDRLLAKLSAHRQRGPLIALLGNLSMAEATSLSPVAELGSSAFAIVITDRPQDTGGVLEVLRTGGWRAVAVSREASLYSIWGYFDDAQAMMASKTAAALDAQRAAQLRLRR